MLVGLDLKNDANFQVLCLEYSLAGESGRKGPSAASYLASASRLSSLIVMVLIIVIIDKFMNHDNDYDHHDDTHQGPFDSRVQRCEALRLSHNPRRPQLQYHCCQVNLSMMMVIMTTLMTTAQVTLDGQILKLHL